MGQNPVWWKLALIAVVVAVAVIAAYPLDEKINLGLDLRGGALILMQVDTDAALKFEMSAAQSFVGQALERENISYSSVLVTGPTTLELRGIDPAAAAEARQVVEQALGDWQVSSQGAGNWRVTMPAQRRSQVEVEAVETTRSTIERRINGLGVSEPLVQKQGIAGDRILVLMPGVEDPSRVKDVIGDTQLLEWKEVTYPPSVTDPCSRRWVPPTSREGLLALFGGAVPADTEIFPEDDPQSGATYWWPLKRVSVVRGTDLVNARPITDEWGQPQVSFELNQDAGRRFEAATRENVGCVMAIVMGTVDEKRVLSAPTIQSAIRDQGVITGSRDMQDAEDFALQLRSGAIPTDLRIIEERTVGPSLGRDSIRAGLVAGTTGFLGVMLFMLIYYRLAGMNAVVALALNIVLVFGGLGALPFLFSGFSGARATLTLPGIAGLILTVGMAVDSNVLIFERIREELGLGKTVRSAIEQGFGRAFTTILDCNITTLGAALFLFLYGTGPVKGFAVTLFIGLLASMFTAVFVSRQLFELVLLAKGSRADSLSI